MHSIAERHKYILESLNKNGFITVSNIANDLNVTTVTIRKDLKSLEEKKLLSRTHGSASSSIPLTSDIDVHLKEKIRKEEKTKIAIAACKLIEENDSIMMASGSTVYTFAEQIKPINHLNIVTASLKISMLLNNINNIDIIQLGGIVRKNSLSVISNPTLDLFKDINCSKLFIGVDGIDIEYGITNSNIEEALLNKKMIDTSLKTIILADSSKFGRRGFGKVCALDQIDLIITDSGISESMIKLVEDTGIKLIIA